MRVESRQSPFTDQGSLVQVPKQTSIPWKHWRPAEPAFAVNIAGARRCSAMAAAPLPDQLVQYAQPHAGPDETATTARQLYEAAKPEIHREGCLFRRQGLGDIIYGYEKDLPRPPRSRPLTRQPEFWLVMPDDSVRLRERDVSSPRKPMCPTWPASTYHLADSMGRVHGRLAIRGSCATRN